MQTFLHVMGMGAATLGTPPRLSSMKSGQVHTRRRTVWKTIGRGRTLVTLTNDVSDLKSDTRHIRDDLDVVTMRVIRIDNALGALRDDLRALGSRISGLEASSS